MTTQAKNAPGPDLSEGVPIADLGEDGLLEGHVGKEIVVLARAGDHIHAVGGKCTHYGGRLARGVLVGETIRCPLHHACFSIPTGEALRAPAIDPIPRWKVERRGDRICHRQTRRSARFSIAGGKPRGRCAKPDRDRWRRCRRFRCGGNAPSAALRRKPDTFQRRRPRALRPSEPVQGLYRGRGARGWMPLRPQLFYEDNDIDLRLGTRVEFINAEDGTMSLAGGERVAFDRLLLATGAEPIRPDFPGATSQTY